MGLKPMNCPGHFLIFGSEMRSYRDLPLRFHEQTPLHRNEASGVLSGLTRVRQFSQDDGHCFVMRGADRRRGRSAPRADPARLRRLRPAYTAQARRRGRRSSSARSRRGTTPRRAEAGARGRRTAVHHQRGRRRVLRPEDRLRHHRRARPQVAVRDDSARLQDAGAVRPEVHRRRQRRAPAGRHPPRDLRQLRALHRAS